MCVCLLVSGHRLFLACVSFSHRFPVQFLLLPLPPSRYGTILVCRRPLLSLFASARKTAATTVKRRQPPTPHCVTEIRLSDKGPRISLVSAARAGSLPPTQMACFMLMIFTCVMAFDQLDRRESGAPVGRASHFKLGPTLSVEVSQVLAETRVRRPLHWGSPPGYCSKVYRHCQSAEWQRRLDNLVQHVRSTFLLCAVM